MTKTGTDMTRRGVLGALGLGMLVSGCASSAPSAYYSVRAADAAGLGGRSSRVQVLVAAPRALKALDSSYIAVVDKGPVYSYFPDSAWADTLPNVVQLKLVETLQNTGRLRGVGVPGDGLLIDYQLQTEIRAFELRVDGTDRGSWKSPPASSTIAMAARWPPRSSGPKPRPAAPRSTRRWKP